MTAISKTQSSFYRRLYVAHLVAGDTASVPAQPQECLGEPHKTP